jgi:UDP-glucose 4-epimerase
VQVLVTGGAGFIGANLVRLLLEQGQQVTVLDDLSAGRLEYLQGLPVDFIEGSILDRDLVQLALEGKDGIVHLAAQTGVPGSLINPYCDCEVNVIGTLNVLEACRKEGVDRFVFASSNAPLGRQPPPATEDKAPLPISPYGASKLAGEGYCLAYHGSWGLNTVVLRFANVYGPYSTHKNSVVAKFFKDIVGKGQITIDGDGEQTRDFVYVGDLCRAILLALLSDVGGEVFQIATGVETSIRQLAVMVQEVIGKSVDISLGPSRQGDIRKNYSTVSKVSRMLEWEPTTSLQEGLEIAWDWFVATQVGNSFKVG